MLVWFQELPRTAGVLLMGTGGSAPAHSTTYFEVVVCSVFSNFLFIDGLRDWGPETNTSVCLPNPYSQVCSGNFSISIQWCHYDLKAHNLPPQNLCNQPWSSCVRVEGEEQSGLDAHRQEKPPGFNHLYQRHHSICNCHHHRHNL